MDDTTPRKPVHLRRIHIEGFEREDGLIDIEGTLTDTKPYAIETEEKPVPADTAIHQMRVRITIDSSLTIVGAQATTLAGPYSICGDIAPVYRQLEGLHIGPGFTKTVKRLFRGVQGCSHITELLPPMATTAYQIVWAKPGSYGGADEGVLKGQSPIDGCHALRTDGPVVMKYYAHLRANKDPA